MGEVTVPSLRHRDLLAYISFVVVGGELRRSFPGFVFRGFLCAALTGNSWRSESTTLNQIQKSLDSNTLLLHRQFKGISKHD